MPLPRRRSFWPLSVPGGTVSVARPSSVGTSIFAPRIASAIVTGTSTNRSRPSRRNTGCGRTRTVRPEVARRAAAEPGRALAAQADAPAVGDARRDAHGERLGPQAPVLAGELEREALLAALRGLEEVELELRLEVRAAQPRRAARAAAPAEAEAAEQVVEVAELEGLAAAAYSR